MTKINKTQKKIDLGQGKFRYRITVDGFPCEPNTQVSVVQFRNLIIQLNINPDLVICGGFIPRKTQIVHDGLGWVLEAEIEVDEKKLERT